MLRASLPTEYWDEHDVAAMNSSLEEEVEALQGLLAAALSRDDLITFSALKRPASVPPWEHADLEQAEPAPVLEEFMPLPSAGWSKMLGKGKREQAVADGRARYEQAVEAHRLRQEQRSRALASARADWQATVALRQAEAKNPA
jgi:hypothetical protein